MIEAGLPRLPIHFPGRSQSERPVAMWTYRACEHAGRAWRFMTIKRQTKSAEAEEESEISVTLHRFDR